MPACSLNGVNSSDSCYDPGTRACVGRSGDAASWSEWYPPRGRNLAGRNHRSRMYVVHTWSAADPASIGQSLPQDNLCHGRGRRKTDARAASRRKASACKQILNRKASACIQRISLVKYGTRRTTYRICINTGPVHANNSKPRRPTLRPSHG